MFPKKYKILCWGFGYSPSCDDYKIVILYKSFVKIAGITPPWVSYAYVYSLRANQWRGVAYGKQEPTQVLGLNHEEPSVQVGETLHWALQFYPRIANTITLAFNLADDSTRLVPLPHPNGRNHSYYHIYLRNQKQFVCELV